MNENYSMEIAIACGAFLFGYWIMCLFSKHRLRLMLAVVSSILLVAALASFGVPGANRLLPHWVAALGCASYLFIRLGAFDPDDN